MIDIPTLPSREKRDGLILVYTGNGKGKTTASLGVAMRALGWGWKVAIVQFIKGKWKTGEKSFADSANLPIDIFPMGDGFTWKTQDKVKDTKTAKKTWDFALEKIKSENYDLIILDEINIALKHGFLDLEPVINALNKKPKWMNIILTGRDAQTEIIQIADLVSEIKEIKHPFKNGIEAQRGIEF